MTNQISVGSIAWYAELLGDEHASLTRQLTQLYADKDHTFTVERKDRQLSDRTSVALHEPWFDPEAKERRLQIWALDSSLWTIEEYRLGHYTHALRGLLQATAYYAQTKGNITPSHLFSIRNALEAVTEYVVARTSYCRCGVTILACQTDTIGAHDIRLRTKAEPCDTAEPCHDNYACRIHAATTVGTMEHAAM